MTAFVLDTVTSRAKQVVKQHQDLVVSNDAFGRFIAELDKRQASTASWSICSRRTRSCARRELREA